MVLVTHIAATALFSDLTTGNTLHCCYIATNTFIHSFNTICKAHYTSRMSNQMSENLTSRHYFQTHKIRILSAINTLIFVQIC